MEIDNKNSIIKYIIPAVLLQAAIYLISLILGVNEEFEDLMIFYFIAIAGILIASIKIDGNNLLVIVFAVLISIGMLTQCVLSRELSGYEDGATNFLINMLCGTVAFIIIILMLNYKNRLTTFFFTNEGCILLTIVSLICFVVCMISGHVNGASNWIIIGGFSIQGTEISKFIYLWIIAVLSARSNFEQYGGSIVRLYSINAFFYIIVNELGYLIIITLVTLCIVLVRSDNLKKLYISARRSLAILGLILIVGVIVVLLAYALEGSFGGGYITGTFEKVQGRLLGFLFPEKYADSYGYQSVLATNAIFDGGLFGSGKKIVLPVAQSDMVFGAIVAIFGLVFGLAVIVLYLLFFIVASRVSYNKESCFGFTFVIGISVQMIYNFGYVIGFLPIAGIPAYYISSGGTAMVCAMIMASIIVSVSGDKFQYKEGGEEYGEKNYGHNSGWNMFDSLDGNNTCSEIGSNPGNIRADRLSKRSFNRERKKRADDYWNHF
ncbi:MAG: FtsW/RodA/SpoVE family cell cycle protein [Bacillota bacterium]|nr:FtsW/RodA/SpoVE family cell cycle protein [Bacillota bacterium]